MKFLYETDRLLLKVLDGYYAKDILRFYLSNREIFEKYEAQRPENFYTEKYQRRVLSYEYNLCIKQTAIRFWVYQKSDPKHVIGTIGFRDIIWNVRQQCQIGYKFDQCFWHQGYASEALSKGIEVMFRDLQLHRIVAYIMPENKASIHLVERLGFEFEGIAHESALIQGSWEDHAVYSLISSI